MSGPSSRSTLLDWAAAPFSCSRSNVPTAGISRSMMYFRNAISVSDWGRGMLTAVRAGNNRLGRSGQPVCKEHNPHGHQDEVAGRKRGKAMHHIVVSEMDEAVHGAQGN